LTIVRQAVFRRRLSHHIPGFAIGDFCQDWRHHRVGGFGAVKRLGRILIENGIDNERLCALGDERLQALRASGNNPYFFTSSQQPLRDVLPYKSCCTNNCVHRQDNPYFDFERAAARLFFEDFSKKFTGQREFVRSRGA
jgi:hypothetical protein